MTKVFPNCWERLIIVACVYAGAIIMFILGIALLLCAIIVAVGILVVRRSVSLIIDRIKIEAC